MSLKQAIKATLLQQPGLSSTEIARRLGKERNNVRKAAFELETAGELRSQNDGGTFRFYVAGSSARPLEFPKPIGNSPPVIDGEFEVVSPPPSTSRALIPAARNERARRLRSAQGQALGQQSSRHGMIFTPPTRMASKHWPRCSVPSLPEPRRSA